MPSQPMGHALSRTIGLSALVACLTLSVASCSTVPRAGRDAGTAAATTSTASSNDKDKAAQRRRWEAQVERDNALESMGSQPGSFGTSVGPRLSW